MQVSRLGLKALPLWRVSTGATASVTQTRALASRLTEKAFFEGHNLASYQPVDPNEDNTYVVEDSKAPSFAVPKGVSVLGFKYPKAKAPDNKTFYAIAPKNPPMVLSGDAGEYVQNLYIAGNATGTLMKLDTELTQYVLPLAQDEEIGVKFFMNPTIEISEKQAAIAAFVKEHKLSEFVAALLNEVVENEHTEVLAEIVTTFTKLMQVVRCEATAEVSFGRIPTRNEVAEAKELITDLRSPQQYYVHTNIYVDPALGGGMKLKMGDFELDGSLNTRCAEVQKHLTKSLQA